MYQTDRYCRPRILKMNRLYRMTFVTIIWEAIAIINDPVSYELRMSVAIVNNGAASSINAQLKYAAFCAAALRPPTAIDRQR